MYLYFAGGVSVSVTDQVRYIGAHIPIRCDQLSGIAPCLSLLLHHIFAQVLLRWAVQRGTIAIPKSVTPSRIAQNLDIFGFALSPAEMASIAGLDANHRLVKGMQNVRAGQTWHDIWDEGFDFSSAS